MSWQRRDKEVQRRGWLCDAHHGSSSACLEAAQPGHVNGSARAAVGVGRGAMQSVKVVPGMDHQEFFASEIHHTE